MAKFVLMGGIEDLTSLDNCHQLERDTSRTTKALLDILPPLEESDGPGFVLVEGLLGIRKSLLYKK